MPGKENRLYAWIVTHVDDSCPGFYMGSRSPSGKLFLVESQARAEMRLLMTDAERATHAVRRVSYLFREEKSQ